MSETGKISPFQLCKLPKKNRRIWYNDELQQSTKVEVSERSSSNIEWEIGKYGEF